MAKHQDAVMTDAYDYENDAGMAMEQAEEGTTSLTGDEEGQEKEESGSQRGGV